MTHFAVVQSPANNTALTFKRTRIAPTPSGYLHLGNVLSFVLTATLAERHGARILLRIDDMDQERSDPKYVQDIFDTLRFLEIPWHEGPEDAQSFAREYSQIHRLGLYRDMLAALETQGAVFACDCSRSLLASNNKNGYYTGHCCSRKLPLNGTGLCWRLRTDDAPVAVHTWHGVVEKTLPPPVRYFVVKKKDGYPAYQLTSVADDLHFGVDLIVRGEDLWPSTLAQCYLAGKLHSSPFLQSTFVHHPLIKSSDGMKLSKSAGATSIRYLREEGRKKVDVFTLIGQQLGHTEPIPDWRTLGALLLH